MRTFFGMGIFSTFLAMAGCQDVPPTQVDARAKEPFPYVSAESVPYISAEEFAAAVASDGPAVLVEFCVPAGCFRCDEMRGQIDQLATNERERLMVRRVNLNQQPALARQIGVAVCPSYVVFRDGEEVFRAAYPTSADLIMAGLDESLRPLPAK